MAQLPPKIPTIPQNWSSPFPHQRSQSTMSNFIPTTSSSTAEEAAAPTSITQQQQLSSSTSPWVDEFVDFSSARQGAHRRSASDSVAFMESPMMFFDMVDYEQLMSMFPNDVAAAGIPNALPSSTSDPSSPSSDQTSNNDEKPMALDVAPLPVQDQNHHDFHVKPKNEAVEEDGFCKDEAAAAAETAVTFAATGSFETFDPKRVKRILANRQSAQRSRVRKLQYISELERSVTSLQTEVSALSPIVQFLDHQRLILNVDNSTMKQRIAALAQDKIFKDAHQEALKKEIERLRQVYHHQQNINKMGNNNNKEIE